MSTDERIQKRLAEMDAEAQAIERWLRRELEATAHAIPNSRDTYDVIHDLVVKAAAQAKAAHNATLEHEDDDEFDS